MWTGTKRCRSDSMRQTALIEEKRKGKTIKIDDDKSADPRGSNVVDLMAALEKSLGLSATAAKPDAGDAASKKKSAANKSVKAKADEPTPSKAPAGKRA